MSLNPDDLPDLPKPSDLPMNPNDLVNLIDNANEFERLVALLRGKDDRSIRMLMRYAGAEVDSEDWTTFMDAVKVARARH